MLLTCNNTACGGIREPNTVAFPIIDDVCDVVGASEASAVTNCANLRFLVYIFIYLYICMSPYATGHAHLKLLLLRRLVTENLEIIIAKEISY